MMIAACMRHGNAYWLSWQEAPNSTRCGVPKIRSNPPVQSQHSKLTGYSLRQGWFAAFTLP